MIVTTKTKEQTQAHEKIIRDRKIVSLYEKGSTVQELAKAFNLKEDYIYKLTKDQRTKAIVQRFKEGADVDTIAKEFNVSTTSVYQATKKERAKKPEKTLSEAKFLRFDKEGYESKLSTLKRAITHYQAVFDRYPHEMMDKACKLDFQRDFVPLLRDPDGFLRDRLMSPYLDRLKQSFEKNDLPEFDTNLIKENLKMPVNWEDLKHHVNLIFRMFTTVNIMDHMNFLYMNEGKITINDKELRGAFTFYTSSPEEAGRLQYIQALCTTMKSMQKSGLWPDHMFKGGTTKWTQGLEPLYSQITFKRDIADLRSASEAMKAEAFLGIKREPSEHEPLDIKTGINLFENDI